MAKMRFRGLGLLACISASACSGAGAEPAEVDAGSVLVAAPPTSTADVSSIRFDGASYRVINAASVLEVVFDPAAVTMRPHNAPGGWTLTTRVRCIGRSASCDDSVSLSARRLQGNRLEYLRRGAREWYVNDRAGIEQGFDVEERPPGTSSELIVDLALAGLDPVLLDRRTASLRFGGSPVLRVEGLRATDASGRALPAWMSTEPGDLQFHVDDRDAHYPIAIDPFYLAEVGKLVASDGRYGDQFGISAALAGDTAIFGAEQSFGGAAYVFRRLGAGWTQEARLADSTGIGGALFGGAVALSGSTAAIGAREATPTPAVDAGMAYVFVRDTGGASWTVEATLQAPDAASTDEFGEAIAISGDTVVVGAHSVDLPGKIDAGAAYVFTRSGTSWTQQAKLASTDIEAGDEFGTSVAIEGDVIVIGADQPGIPKTGVAYVFTRSGTTWTQQAKLLPDDTTTLYQYFGTAVSISGDTVLVGADNATVGVIASGAAYVFVHGGTTWTQQAKLSASDGEANDRFGRALSVSGDTAIVGSSSAGPSKKAHAGAAYVYVRTGAKWEESARLTPSDVAENDFFGYGVAVSGPDAVVGAPYASTASTVGTGVGYAYRVVATSAPGTKCATGVECTSGFCAEGVCCDTACARPCESCLAARKASGADGACGSAKGDTDPKDACAPGTGVCGADGTCDGAGSCRSFAKPGTPCGTPTCSADGASAKLCAGDKAACIDTPCAPFACDATGCKKTCASASDCAAGYLCDTGACKPATATCTPDGTSSIPTEGGSPHSCSPYRCGEDGTCSKACGGTNDCASGFGCDPDTKSCTPAATNTGSSGGCDLGRGSGGLLAWLGVVALVMAARRRRPRPSP